MVVVCKAALFCVTTTLLLQGDVSILQALIIFGADANKLNHKGESPRHLAALSRCSKRDLVLYTLHAVGSQRCTDDVSGCAGGCSSLGCFDGIAPEKPNFFKSASRKCASRRYGGLYI